MSFNLMDFQDCKTVARIVASRVLEDMLEYEGGTMQSISEAVHCRLNNKRIIKYAKEKGIHINIDYIELGIKKEKS